MSDANSPLYGLIARFSTPAELMSAAEKIRDAGYQKWDVHSPFPIHGMDDAMGLKNSPVGWFTFTGGLLGFSGGYAMIWFMNGYDYSIIVGGKPFFSFIPAFPVAYELTILLGAFGTLLGMAYLNRLPRLHHPLLRKESFRRATDDRFFLVLEASDDRFDLEKSTELLKTLNPAEIQEVSE